MAVFVADVGLIGACVIVNCMSDVVVTLGNGVPVTNDAPGVRNRLTQAGSVRMEASTGSMNPLDLRVRKSLFGSKWESILAFSFQPGENRKAHCTPTITHRNPTPKIRGIINQSRRSCSEAFIHKSLDRQSHKDSCTRIGRFIVTRTFKPDAPMMSLYDAACNGEPQAWSTTLEF